MKRSLRNTSGIAILIMFGTGVLYLNAWTPPDPESDGESINVVGGISTSGPIRMKVANNGNHVENLIDSFFPAIVSGSGNDLIRSGSIVDKGNGIVIGNSNKLSSMGNTGGSQANGIIGNSNDVRASTSLVVGTGNNVAVDSTGLINSAKSSIIFGTQNNIAKGTNTTLVSGANNTVNAKNSLIVGQSNTVEGLSIGSSTDLSSAIGAMNHIMSNNSWTMGHSNEVSSNLTSAIGVGLIADSLGCTFVGDISAPVNGSLTTRRPEDPVFVVGNGTDANNRSNALIVKRNGDVIITKPQGDISMGIYGD